MLLIRNIIVAFSMYSRIPMPGFVWQEEDTKYALGFIGLIGAVIAAVEYGMLAFAEYLQLPILVRTLFFAAIPLMITGGFHVDGFMDVQDALHSYKPKEEKMRILKDPHIGAFAVISLLLYGCLYVAFTYLLLAGGEMGSIVIACLGFVLLRGLGGYLAVTLKHAKREGMLHEETKKTNGVTKGILVGTVVITAAGMLYSSWMPTIIIAIVMFIYTKLYQAKCDKEFGGINGDTIGYFITQGELLVMCIAAIWGWVNVWINGSI